MVLSRRLWILPITATCVFSWTHRTHSSVQPTFLTVQNRKSFVPLLRLSYPPNSNEPFESSSAVPESVASAQDHDHERTTTLCFRASKRFTSHPLPIPFYGNISMMEDFFNTFFSMNETYHTLLKGTKSIVSQRPQEELLLSIQEAWIRECTIVHANIPTFSDPTSERLFQVQTSGMTFPGLQVVSTISIGSTKSKIESHHGFWPEIQFVMIQTENQPKGLLKGIYNALTRGGSKKKSQQSNMEHSLSQISIQPRFNESTFVFTSDVMIEIGVLFPSFLLKILPVSKEKAEEQGSLAVSNFIEKDVQRSLDQISKLYNQTIQSFLSG